MSRFQPLLPPVVQQSDSPGEQGLVVAETKTKSKKPSMFKVLLLNDDYTPMDFVVHILEKFFARSEPEAQKIMLQVHQQGSGVAGLYTYELAETKVYLVNQYSRRHQHPLKCVMEKQ